jgi:MFS family permease
MATQTLNPAEPAQPVAPHPNPHHERRWLILAVLGLAQLMVVLDATIVNIALPTAQHALGFSNADRQWIVTGYALAFGSLLLLGGRLSDIIGRKRASPCCCSPGCSRVRSAPCWHRRLWPC